MCVCSEPGSDSACMCAGSDSSKDKQHDDNENNNHNFLAEGELDAWPGSEPQSLGASNRSNVRLHGGGTAEPGPTPQPGLRCIGDPGEQTLPSFQKELEIRIFNAEHLSFKYW